MKSSKLSTQFSWLQKLKGTILVGIGFLLSPLCWWNDLILNIPLAYGFGYLCSRFSENLLYPGLIVGYWLSNVLGFLFMQMGLGDIVQEDNQERNTKKEIITGLVSSSVFTIIMICLVQFHLIEIPDLQNPSQILLQLKSFWHTSQN